MKKMTIKLKITLWFTFFMVMLSAAVFAFIGWLSSATSAHQVKSALVRLVDDNRQEVEYDDGALDIDDDFISFRNGIYCLVFDADGIRRSGYAPYAALEQQPFEDGRIRTVPFDNETYLIYDRLISDKKAPDLWVRGVVSETVSAVSASAVYQAALIALPLLLLLAAVGGYLLAGHALRPIQAISQTAEEIGNSGDLTKRIVLTGGNKDELYQLADTFNRMFARLETNFEAERNFTADASHELRTPVTTILAQCEYAFENASGEQALYAAIGAIQKQGYRMAHLIESLLQFTRMEQRTESITSVPLDVSDLTLTVCREYRESAEKNITLTTEVQPRVQMNADRVLMARLIGNLLQNAYRYGRENGKITVSLKENDSAIILSVADDGIGISADERPHIWRRFYRADKSRSNGKGTGLGLGLTMVKQIATLHGGVVQVESEPEQGSLFSVTFKK